jgi:mRNA interferase RelE/StbE
VYKIFVSRTAEKQLKKLPAATQRKVAAVILSLGIDPYPYGSKKLSGFESVYRVRVGSYRVLYEIENKRVTVCVLKLGHRRDVYRK